MPRLELHPNPSSPAATRSIFRIGWTTMLLVAAWVGISISGATAVTAEESDPIDVSASATTDSAVDGSSQDRLALILAIRNQDRAEIDRLMDQEFDVNIRQPDGATALHWAVHRDDLPSAKSLLQAGATVDAKNDFGVTPMSLACTNGSAQMIRVLLDGGANPNEPLMTGETPLMTASFTGNVDAVNALLDAGADINATEPVRQQNALMWALGERQSDVVRVLIDRGADIKSTTTLGFQPILFAAREGDLESAKMLLDAGAYVNAQSNKKLTALHVASQRGHIDVALELLRRGADVNNADPGYTALHWAVGTWETEMNGANGMTAPQGHEWDRMRGIQDRKVEFVRELLEHGADPNARLKKSPARFGFTVTRPPTNSTPFTLAAFAGEADIMRLLAEYGADPTLKPSNGQSALLIAAGVNRSTRELSVPLDDLLEAVKVAIELGVDVNDADRGGNTAMHGAAWIRSPEMVQFLHDQGGDVNAKNRAGQSPLHVADHTGFAAGIGERVPERLPVGHLIKQLSVPAVVKDSVDQWAELPPHVRRAVTSLLQGELKNIKQ